MNIIEAVFYIIKSIFSKIKAYIIEKYNDCYR